jgi:Kyakuja-Dileera-Zisupton transposase
MVIFCNRFCNIDYVVLSSLKGEHFHRIVFTYDIGCQYSKNFLERMKAFPSEMHIPKDTLIEFAVPSWHINAHGADCRANFGLSFREGVGRTCGEEIEAAWAGTNALGPSTREMGPGARHETLNTQWGGLNFRRILVFRKSIYFIKAIKKLQIYLLGHEFLHHLKEALNMSKKHKQLFEEFTATFQQNTIESWQRLIDAWTKDQSQPNPYLEPGPCRLMASHCFVLN